ncbi:MAG TPA: MarR family winged helix-turn-helix transcriptional regulator [Acidimicrobiales bacterium]
MDASTRELVFGDALAQARRRWVQESQRRVSAFGYEHFKRSDTVVLRRLRSGPAALVDLRDVIGISRQATRKIVEGLHKRGYVEMTRDEHDARRTLVVLSDDGQRYAEVLVRVAAAMNVDVARDVDEVQMSAALAVLSAVTGRWSAPL